MDTFAQMQDMGHEQVVWCRHRASGLRAIIAIHDTTLGPGLGGCRVWDYASEEEALRDVLRLSRGMTYKAALAGLDLGGGKAVILGDPSIKSEALFRAFGRFVDSLGGRYVTAEDMNTNEQDMEHIARETRWVTGISATLGGSGDPGPVTAWGVYHGIRACLDKVFGSPDPAGRTVAVQGIGSVGYQLCEHLHAAGAKLVVSDIHPHRVRSAVQAFGATANDLASEYTVDCDVFAPCAIGAVINKDTIPVLKAPIVAGAANNQLADEERDAELLAERGIVYAPDYVINAGGLISVYHEFRRWPHDKAMNDAAHIFDTIKRILDKAEAQGTSTSFASNRVAEERIADLAAVQRVRLPH